MWKCEMHLYALKALGLINCRVLHNKVVSNLPYTMGNRHQLRKNKQGPQTPRKLPVPVLVCLRSHQTLGVAEIHKKRNSLSQYLPA